MTRRRRWPSFLGMLLLPTLLATPALAQRDPTHYQEAKAPSPEVLDRLHLTQNWSTFIPLADRFDQIGLVQINGSQIFVQTTGGKLYVLNPANGEIVWSHAFLNANKTLYPLAFTPDRVFAVHGVRLLAFDRQNGRTILDQVLASTPATGPTADLTSVYIPLANNTVVGYSHSRLIFPSRVPPPPERDPVPKGISLQVPAYEPLSTPQNVSPSVAMLNTLKSPYELSGTDAIISVTMLPSLRPPYSIVGNIAPSLGIAFRLSEIGELSDPYVRDISPTQLFNSQLGRGIASVPIVTKDNVLLPTVDQTVIAVDRVTGNQLFDFSPRSKINAPVTVVGRYAFVATGDSTIYEIDTERLAVIWRYVGGARINRKPFLTDRTVFAAGTESGITMIERDSGERLWSHNVADQVLAVNPKFVYANDRMGRLHVIDRARGTSLSQLDMRQFSLSVVNEQDDRLYFAARNGLLVSLRDKEYRNPVLAISPPKLEKKDAPLAAEPKKADPLAEEPKKDEPKKAEPKKLEPKKDAKGDDEMKKE